MQVQCSRFFEFEYIVAFNKYVILICICKVEVERLPGNCNYSAFRLANVFIDFMKLYMKNNIC